jgi:hypothetical protein
MKRNKSSVIDQPNHWGIPDWADPLAYGNVQEWSIYRWRWEFCRRDPELRSAFQLEAKRLAAAPSDDDYFEEFSKKLPFVNTSIQTREKFGYCIMPNPKLSLEPDPSWHDKSINPQQYVFHRRTIREIFLDNQLSFIDQTGQTLGHFLNMSMINIDHNQVAVTFDLDRPLRPQLEAAKKALEVTYRSKGLEPNPRDRLADQWLTLLRTLDARAVGAHWSKIAEMHRSDATPQGVREKHNQAKAMWRKLKI